jgi:hypothetical protein
MYAMLKPGFVNHLGDALDLIAAEDLGVVPLRFGCVSRQTVLRGARGEAFLGLACSTYCELGHRFGADEPIGTAKW